MLSRAVVIIDFALMSIVLLLLRQSCSISRINTTLLEYGLWNDLPSKRRGTMGGGMGSEAEKQERGGERERERQKQRQKDRDTEREREGDRDRVT